MANVSYYERSFWNTPWEDVIDPDAPQVQVPVGAISDELGGWAHQNLDGTYTVFLGEDLEFNGLGEPYQGTLLMVARVAQISEPLAGEDVLAQFVGPFDALEVYNAFYQGGDALFYRLYEGDDTVTIEGPVVPHHSDISPVIETGEGDDTVNGSDAADIVHGNRGDDLIFGNDGDDFLHGNRGRDEIDGGMGDDAIFGGIGADLLQGGHGDDLIEGGAGDDTLEGWVGDDVIHGNGGDDLILGGSDNDRLYGDAGADNLFGHLGDDSIEGGNGADRLLGHEGDDRIDGGHGADTLFGDEGNDHLVGGWGDDAIDGGDGTDRAVFYLPRAYYDVTVNGDIVYVTALSGNEGHDMLYDVEMLFFTDQVMFV